MTLLIVIDAQIILSNDLTYFEKTKLLYLI